MTWHRSRKNARCWQAHASLVVFGLVQLGIGRTASADDASLRLAAVRSPSPTDTSSSLPLSIHHVDAGAAFFVEVWAQTQNPLGLSSVSLDITYNAGLASVQALTHTTLFPALPHGVIDNANGLLDDLSGSHLGPCNDGVAVAPNWARFAVLEVSALGSGVLTVQSRPTGSPVYGTSVCGVGDIDPARISFAAVALGTGDTHIPAVSEWGLLIMALMMGIAGTLVLYRTLRRVKVG